MGSSLGGIFGSSIGGIMDGPRGADAGRALGMIIGGAAGAAATAPKQQKQTQVGRYDEYTQERSVDEYNRRSSSVNRRSATIDRQTGISVPDGYEALQIEDLRFMDQNNDHRLNANERAKLVFEIRNTGSRTLYNVAPVVDVSDSKHILISPTAIVGSIAPGKAVRYTAELYAKKNLKNGNAQFRISFAQGKVLYTVRRFELRTQERR